MYCLGCATPIEAGQTKCPMCGLGVAAVPAAVPALLGNPVEQRPHHIVLATALLALAVALSVFSLMLAWISVGVRVTSIRFIWVGPLLLTLWAILTVLTWTRYEWARILVLIGIGWSVISLVRFMMIAGVGGVMLSPLSWLSLGLRSYAAYLLYRPDSDRWFRPLRP